jgi:hypothetical protein
MTVGWSDHEGCVGPRPTTNTGQTKSAKKILIRKSEELLENLGVHEHMIIKRPLKSRIERRKINSCTLGYGPVVGCFEHNVELPIYVNAGILLTE